MSALRDFASQRFALGKLKSFFADAHTPGGGAWGRTFGQVLVALILLETVTGLALMSVYAPSPQTAWASTLYMQQHLPMGALVRGVHHWAAQVILLVVGANVLRAVTVGAYRAPREGTFWVTLAIGALAIGLVHTGTFLPWDQRAFWMLRVEAGYALESPVGGAAVARQLQGGPQAGALSLTRMYTLHAALLPLLLFVALAARWALLREHGFAPTRRDEPEGERYWPTQAVRDALVAFIVLAAVTALARKFGAPLDAPADPDSEYPARPEWFLLGLFRMRKWFAGKYELFPIVVVPGLAVGFVAMVPLIDRAGRGVRRVIAVAGTWLVLGALGGVTAYAIRADQRDATYVRARAEADRHAARAAELARGGVPPEGPQDLLRNDPRERPHALYVQHCGGCHAENGAAIRDAAGRRTNARGPSLQGFGARGWATAMLVHPDADDLFGRTDIHDMPSQQRRLQDDGVRAVAEYLHSVGAEPGDASPPDAALVAQGQAMYYRRCTTCHLGPRDPAATPEDLEAMADADAPDLTGWGSRAWIREQITNPAARAHYGARNAMPGFAEELTGRDLEYVVDYVRSLRTAQAPRVTAPAPRE